MTITKEIDWTLFSDGEIEDIVDKGLRHRTGKTPLDYLKHWIFIGRQFAFATHDDSWGEFEKEFAIIVKRMVAAERDLKASKVNAQAWEIVAKQNGKLASLTPNEQCATLEKALESEIADHMKTRDELDRLRRSISH